jgi:hypothetical protein
MKNYYLIFLLLFAFLTGCQTSKGIFYWGNYSETLYELKKEPDEKTLETHKEQLLKIIETSMKKNKLVPPGVYAEYGYLLLKEGKEDEGMEYLNKEESNFPESRTFIERIKTKDVKGEQ